MADSYSEEYEDHHRSAALARRGYGSQEEADEDQREVDAIWNQPLFHDRRKK